MMLFFHVGRYFLFLREVFSKPEKLNVYAQQIVKEIDKLIISSLGITIIISAFMGMVITLQTAYNVDSPFIPKYTIGYATRDAIILEFSSTILCLILAGKIGSNIASEIGTMKVTEQIDALEIMGVNPACLLVLPKIISSVLFSPILYIISVFVGLLGGWVVCIISGVVTPSEYLDGILLLPFNAFKVLYSIIKTSVFGFIIASVSSCYGYYTKGGALEVGVASTRAVVFSSILILLFNLLLTQLLLT